MKHLIICIIMMLVSISSFSQNVVREGNTFTVVEKKKETKPIKTQYTFIVRGKKYPIYLSAKGKAYIIRLTKKGEEYKQYLPEVTKQLTNK